jgi:hypothetical protein
MRVWRKLHDRRKLLPAHAAAWLAYCRRMLLAGRRMLPALGLAGRRMLPVLGLAGRRMYKNAYINIDNCK